MEQMTIIRREICQSFDVYSQPASNLQHLSRNLSRNPAENLSRNLVYSQKCTNVMVEFATDPAIMGHLI